MASAPSTSSLLSAIITSSLTHLRFESAAADSADACPALTELRRVRSIGGREYALKCLRPRRASSAPLTPDLRPPLDREIEIHAAVTGHAHILPYVDCFVVDGHYHVVFDAARGGSLAAHVRERARFQGNDEEIRRVFLQLVDAIRHCHSLGIAHRDIRPENFLAGDYSGRTYFLSGFEHATADKKSADLGIGSKAFMSPECLGSTRWKRDYDTHASDIWSLGIVLVYMVAGALPWDQAHPTDTRYAEYIRDRSYLQSYLPLSKHLIPLLSRILEPEPKRRISLAALESGLDVVRSLTIEERELESGEEARRVATARARGLAVDVGKSRTSGSGREPRVRSPARRSMGEAAGAGAGAASTNVAGGSGDAAGGGGAAESPSDSRTRRRSSLVERVMQRFRKR